jgi:hypothetical protein
MKIKGYIYTHQLVHLKVHQHHQHIDNYIIQFSANNIQAQGTLMQSCSLTGHTLSS